jgi:hypothetical protein
MKQQILDLEVYTTESGRIVLKQYCAFDPNDPQLLALDAHQVLLASERLKQAAAEVERQGVANA